MRALLVGAGFTVLRSALSGDSVYPPANARVLRLAVMCSVLAGGSPQHGTPIVYYPKASLMALSVVLPFMVLHDVHRLIRLSLSNFFSGATSIGIM